MFSDNSNEGAIYIFLPSIRINHCCVQTFLMKRSLFYELVGKFDKLLPVVVGDIVFAFPDMIAYLLH